MGDWAGQGTGWGSRYNMTHVAAGSPAGGEFGPASSSGTSRPAAAGTRTPAGQGAAEEQAEAEVVAELHAQAAADRAQAKILQAQLKTAETAHHAAARKPATSHKAKTAPKTPARPRKPLSAKAKAAKAAAAKAKTATLSHHQRHISHLQHEIHVLLTQAAQLDAQAAAIS